ncbi:hypothetical protein [Streptomyces avermitilis]|uniref:hypothetical protein n=1 Tax=Streptomyces avermitilis TaxID=33903 RepID=UPI0033B10710
MLLTGSDVGAVPAEWAGALAATRDQVLAEDRFRRAVNARGTVVDLTKIKAGPSLLDKLRRQLAADRVPHPSATPFNTSSWVAWTCPGTGSERRRIVVGETHSRSAAAAEGLLATLDADERGPWVLSPAQLDVLARAMDVRNTVLPSTSRQHLRSTPRSRTPAPGAGAPSAPEHRTSETVHPRTPPPHYPDSRRPPVSVKPSVYAVYGMVIAPSQDLGALRTALEAQPASLDPGFVHVDLFSVGDSEHTIPGAAYEELKPNEYRPVSDCPVPLDLDRLPSGFDGRELVSSECDHRRSATQRTEGALSR